VIDLYGAHPGSLTDDDLATALAFADAATELLLAEHVPGGQVAASEGLFAQRAVVHQATGMVSAQLDVPIIDAFLRLRAHAYAAELSLDEVSRNVVDRRLRFSGSDGHEKGDQ
jgi:hypothetical protein